MIAIPTCMNNTFISSRGTWTELFRKLLLSTKVKQIYDKLLTHGGNWSNEFAVITPQGIA